MISNQDGFLIQDKNIQLWSQENLKCVTKISPDENDMKELLFAWKLVKHIKSNAIIFSKDRQSLGIGAGQMSRVDSVRIAVQKAKEQNKNLQKSYLASDAFFPFKDVVDIAGREGVKAIIQPGGSIRDKETIQAADEANIIMLFTGMRHFKH